MARRIALPLALALTACGGGGGGDEPFLDAPSPGGGGDTGTPRPNFAVLAFDTAPRTRGLDLSASVSVANLGETGAAVPGAWLQVSGTEDFSDGWAKVDVTLRPSNPGQPPVLEPGEERQFTLASVASPESVVLGLAREGRHYARIWLNPDLSAHFENPEPRVETSHEIVETDYADNRSDVVSFMSGDGDDPTLRGCDVDVYEENDSLEAAAPLALDTPFDVNHCDDRLDVFEVDLVEGQAYTLTSVDTGSQTVLYTIVDASGRYVARSIPVDGVVRADRAGPHYMIIALPAGFLGRRAALSFDMVS